MWKSDALQNKATSLIIVVGLYSSKFLYLHNDLKEDCILTTKTGVYAYEAHLKCSIYHSKYAS